MYHELIYTGLLRTNVATILHEIKLKNQIIPLSSELFATTGDVYLILEMISNNEFTVETADRAIATKENSLIRLARVICSDINQLTETEIKDIAEQIKNKQLDIISKALKHVLYYYKKEYEIEPEIILIGSGANNLGKLLMQKNKIKNWIIESDILHNQVLNSFTAYAVAKLFVAKNEK